MSASHWRNDPRGTAAWLLYASTVTVACVATAMLTVGPVRQVARGLGEEAWLYAIPPYALAGFTAVRSLLGAARGARSRPSELVLAGALADIGLVALLEVTAPWPLAAAVLAAQPPLAAAACVWLACDAFLTTSR